MYFLRILLEEIESAKDATDTFGNGEKPSLN